MPRQSEFRVNASRAFVTTPTNLVALCEEHWRTDVQDVISSGHRHTDPSTLKYGVTEVRRREMARRQAITAYMTQVTRSAHSVYANYNSNELAWRPIRAHGRSWTPMYSELIAPLEMDLDGYDVHRQAGVYVIATDDDDPIIVSTYRVFTPQSRLYYTRNIFPHAGSVLGQHIVDTLATTHGDTTDQLLQYTAVLYVMTPLSTYPYDAGTVTHLSDVSAISKAIRTAVITDSRDTTLEMKPLPVVLTKTS